MLILIISFTACLDVTDSQPMATAVKSRKRRSAKYFLRGFGSFIMIRTVRLSWVCFALGVVMWGSQLCFG